MISSACSLLVKFAPRQSTLASLWLRAMIASPTSLHTAALTPGILLAAMLIPIPLPQMSIPFFFVFVTISPRS